MKKNYLFQLFAAIMLIACFQKAIAQNIATFDNLSLNPSTAWNGSDNSGGFTSSGFFFENAFTDFGGGMFSWYGFAYSNMTDSLTNGYTNQFSAITGKGVLNSNNYAVSYVNYDWMNNYKVHPNTLRFATPKIISGFYATNNTYAYFSMLNGDGSLAKKFGGQSGNDPDWFKLQIKGFKNGNMTDTVNCFLADFRFSIQTQDYILKNWKWVDLYSLGEVDSLEFTLTSSDNGAYGMNTPSYFCMDNFNGVNPVISVFDLKNSDSWIHIYPNPFIETIQIECDKKDENLNVVIYDNLGKEIINIGNENQEFTLNLADLLQGIYFVKISGSDFIQYRKIIKK
ncbi:MAG: DUF4465 domain-containing protein [Bacteroidales bacterium]